MFFGKLRTATSLMSSQTLLRGQNSARPPAETSSGRHLAGPVDVKMPEKSRLRITFFFFSSLKHLQTFAMVN